MCIMLCITRATTYVSCSTYVIYECKVDNFDNKNIIGIKYKILKLK